MNQKRFWPGVPNRYSTTLVLMVMRPKSRATVVVSLPSMPARSSTCTPASVSSSSVRSGSISDTDATMVVLPVPNPPAMTILTAVGTVSWSSDPTNTIQYGLQEIPVGDLGGGVLHEHVTAFDQVRQQDLHDDERHVEVGGDLGDRERACAQGHDLAMFDRQRRLVGRKRGSPDLSHQVQIGRVRPGAAAHHRVGPHQRPRGLVVPPVVAPGHQRDSRAEGTVAVSARGADERYVPTRLTSMFISYAIMPMSASSSPRTARHAPCPAAVT